MSDSDRAGAATGTSSLNSSSLSAAHCVHATVGRLHVGGRGEVQVLRHRQVEDVRVRLIGHAEAEPPGLGGSDAPAMEAADLDGPCVRMDEAARDPEQCRFPGPVLPHERVDLAGAAVDADVAERLYRSERLRHTT